MKYAIVQTKLAEAKGMRTKHHKKSVYKKLMVMNENELKLFGDPHEVAKELGGELTDIKSIKQQINSKLWQTK